MTKNEYNNKIFSPFTYTHTHKLTYTKKKRIYTKKKSQENQIRLERRRKKTVTVCKKIIHTTLQYNQCQRIFKHKDNACRRYSLLQNHQIARKGPSGQRRTELFQPASLIWLCYQSLWEKKYFLPSEEH